MEPMTPEERILRMENLMQSVIESQVQLQAQQEAVTQAQVRNEAEIEKHTAAIRDLVLVSRTLIESQQKTDAQIDRLMEAQQITDEKLHALIDTVDRIIRNLKPN
jgi:hypothetical protein